MRSERWGWVASLAGALLCASAFAAVAQTENTPAAGPALLPGNGDLFTLGDPLASIGKQWADHGIYLKGFYQGTLYSNVTGGNRRGSVYFNDVLYGTDLDLQKLAGVDGTVVHFSMDSRFGGLRQGVNDLAGSTMGFLQGAGPSNVTRLNEFSLDQYLFDGKLRFVVGRTTLANYFATSDLYCDFVVTVCSNIGPFNWSADSNAPFWPISTWAGQAAFWPNPNMYLRAGASESNPSQFPHGGFPWNDGWSTKGATGVFVPVEVGYSTSADEDRYARKYDIGFFYDSTDFPDPQFNTQGQRLALFGGTPASDGAQTAVYAQAQQIVWRPDPSKPQGLTAFGAVMFNTSGRALVQSYLQLGLVQRGTLPSRPNDSVGLLFMDNVFNGRASGAVNDRIAAQGLTGTVSNSEQIVEVNYDIELAPGFHLKPFTDLTFNPDQNLFDVNPTPRNNFALAVGAQFMLLFNDAFGLPSFFRAN